MALATDDYSSQPISDQRLLDAKALQIKDCNIISTVL